MPDSLSTRDHRIDLLRGIALVMIFINHIPGTLWENLTSRNFGFSDAAEGFVLMSGIATGLAYGPAFLRGTPTWEQALRPWRRSVTLWSVHVAVVLFIFALFALTIDQPGVRDMAEQRNILPVVTDPGLFLPALVALAHQLAYADILPVYIVLMLFAPAILFTAARWPWLTLLASALLWFAVGLWHIRMPTYPLDYGWFFNPMAWQLLFVTGIVTGLFLRQGKRIAPVRPWLLRLSIGFLILSAVWVQVPVVAAWGGHGLWLLAEHAGFSPNVTAFDKGMLYLPRLLHILALAYVLSVLPIVKQAAAHPQAAPLRLLGRQSLPVFAIGTVLAYTAQVVKSVLPPSLALDTGLIAVGLCILFAVAYVFEDNRRSGPGVVAQRA